MMQKWMLFALFLSTAVRAEFFIDVFGGGTRVQDGSFTAAENREIEIPGGWLTSQGDLSGADSTGLGLRAGYWIGAKNLHWLGAAVDLSGFRADAQDADADVTVVTASLMLMLRYPLMVSEAYPYGRIYPYAGIGATRAVIDISPPSDQANGTVNSDMGGVLSTGLKWMATPHWGFFAEYRFVSFTFDDRDVDSRRDLFGFPHTRVFEAEGDITAHQFLGGISWHF